MNSAGRMAGKVALVTGAARGLGRACAVRLAEEGADLVLLDIGVVRRIETVERDLGSAADLELTAGQVRSLGRRATTRFVDVRDGAALAAAVHAGQDQLGPINVAVAAAGVSSSAPAWSVTDTQWRAVLDINLTGVWQTMKAVSAGMREQRSGSIVLLGSSATTRPESGRSHELAAKHGVVGLLQSFGRELAPFNVRVNSVDATHLADPIGHPGPDVSADAEMLRPGALPLPSVEAIDVANAVLYLASDEARCVTGASILVDLGRTITS